MSVGARRSHTHACMHTHTDTHASAHKCSLSREHTHTHTPLRPRRLDLSGQRFDGLGPQGVEAFVGALRHNSVLQELGLASNALGVGGGCRGGVGALPHTHTARARRCAPRFIIVCVGWAALLAHQSYPYSMNTALPDTHHKPQQVRAQPAPDKAPFPGRTPPTCRRGCPDQRPPQQHGAATAVHWQ